MKAPSQPKAPDARATAAADQAGNVGTAIAQTALNNANEVSPFGNVNYDITGHQTVKDAQGNDISVPTYTRTQTLSEDEQAKLDLENRIALQSGGIAEDQLGRLEQSLATPITLDDLPAAGVYDPDRYEAALFERLNPQLDRDRAALDTQLANQGIKLGSEAHQDAMRVRQQGENDARIATILGAQQYGLNDVAAADTSRERRLQENLAVRNQPLNEISALMSGNQVNMPQFSQFRAGTIAPTSVGDNIWRGYDADMQAYNLQQQNRNAMMGGLFGLGSSYIESPHSAASPIFMASMAELKTDIAEPKDFLARLDELDVKTWRYSPSAQMELKLDGELHIGPMADQWKELFGGDGRQINLIDANGVLFQICKELLHYLDHVEARVQELEGELGICR